MKIEDNLTILITGLIGITILAIITQNKDLALAIGSGLIGYLSKNTNTETPTKKNTSDPCDMIQKK